MKISFQTRFPFPRALVYRTYRDRVVELSPYLPNVRQIEEKRRWEEGRKTHCVTEWHGGGEIPAIARAVLSEDLLSWTEYDTWNNADFTLDWRIETHLFTKAVHCVGQNTFLEENGTTLFRNEGELSIDPNHLESIPFFLRSQIAAIVESVLGERIEPNMHQLSEGVRQYLTQNTSEL